jgi:hypothetical protein
MNLELEITKMLKEIKQIIADNQDLREKVVGDRVIIWDYSSCIDTKGIKHHKFTGHDNEVGIVIQTNCETKTPKTFEEHYNADLLIVYNNGDKIYSSSDMVKLVP